jgi:hypothetical protein
MVGLVIKNRSEGVCVQPRWWKYVRAPLSLEEECEPQGNVGSVRRIERFYASLEMMSSWFLQSSVSYLFSNCVWWGAGGACIPQEARVLPVFDVVLP